MLMGRIEPHTDFDAQAMGAVRYATPRVRPAQ